MRKVLFLFGQLNDDDVEWMLSAGRKRPVPRGRGPDPPGRAGRRPVHPAGGAARRRCSAGQEREIARLNAGEIVGEMSFVDARPALGHGARRWRTRPSSPSPRPCSSASWPPTTGFAARFYRALAIYLSTTVRERHRALG